MTKRPDQDAESALERAEREGIAIEPAGAGEPMEAAAEESGRDTGNEPSGT
jgi:hypothetical protein